ncbi:MAG: hypothetical protein R2691_00925 [Solirubrobacterales bacterium]
MGEDQDAAGPRSLDEADCGHGLAGAGRVLEPEATARVGVLRRIGDEVLLLAGGLVGPVLRLLVLAERILLLAGAVAGPLDGAAAGPVAVAARPRLLDLGDHGRERPREGVDLVLGELGAVAEGGMVLGENALEPEQQREVLAPLRRRLREALLDLDEGGIERQPAGGAGMKVGERLAVEQDRLARELLDALEIGARWLVGRDCGEFAGFCHEKACRCACSVQDGASCAVSSMGQAVRSQVWPRPRRPANSPRTAAPIKAVDQAG